MEKIETHTVKPKMSFLENDIENMIMSTQEEERLESKYKEIQNMMQTRTAKGGTEAEKDSLYEESRALWDSFVGLIKDAKYNFHLNRRQKQFLTDLILVKMEYDVNTVFFAIELTNMMKNMKDMEYSNDKDLLSFPVNATEMTYIYHLISKHKVKGLTRDAYLFTEVLYRIGNISKIFNYYETLSKNLAADIQDWVATFEDGVVMDEVSSKEETEVIGE